LPVTGDDVEKHAGVDQGGGADRRRVTRHAAAP
jgi:hypothetical protein